MDLYNFKEGNLARKVPGEFEPQHPTKDVTFDIKAVDEEEGTFEGYAAVFGNVDSYGDVIVQGAFKKTLQERGDRVKILWQHDPRQPIGKPLEMKETDFGLWVKGKIITQIQKGQEVLALMKEGVIDELSIGFRTVKKHWDDGIRYLSEVKLLEFSPVTFAANDLARVTGVKSVINFQDLLLAGQDKQWDKEKAVARLREHAGGPDKEDIDWQTYKKGFFYYNKKENGDYDFSDFKFPYADVIDGTLKAVPNAIFAGAAILQGAMGGTNIPDKDQKKMKNQMERYYAKMRDEFDDDSIVAPWNEDNKNSTEMVLYSVKGLADNLVSEVKAGRVLSERNKKLVQKAIEALQALLDATKPDDEDDDSTSGKAAVSGDDGEAGDDTTSTKDGDGEGQDDGVDGEEVKKINDELKDLIQSLQKERDD